MKVQNKEVVFDFFTGAEYDNIAVKKGIRSLYGLVTAIRNEFQRLELLYGKPVAELDEKQMEAFNLDLNLSESFALFQATLGLSVEETRAILNKELKNKNAMQLASEILMEFMSSDLFKASMIKEADENPKQPK